MFHITNSTLFADDAEMFVKFLAYTLLLCFLTLHCLTMKTKWQAYWDLLLSDYLPNFKYLVQISAPKPLLVSLVFGSAANHLN